MGVWRSGDPEPVTEAAPADLRLAALEARVDQVRQFFRETAKAHRENRVLVNALLDADNLLHGPYPEGGG